MFARSGSQAWLTVFVDILQPFSLANGVVEQADVALLRQTLCEGLVRRFSLAVAGMTAGAHNARDGASGCWGQIQIRGYRETGPAFKDHFFDAVGRPRENPGNPRVERCTCGKRAKAESDFFADLADVLFGVRSALEVPLDAVVALLEFSYLANEELMDHARKPI